MFKTAFVHPNIKPSFTNFEKLLASRSPIQKFVLWDNKDFASHPILFNESDQSLLTFISILLNKSITTKGYFGIWLSELTAFQKQHNIDINDTLTSVNLLNELQKKAIDKELLDYRISISPSKMHSLEKLVIKIPCKPDSDTTYRLIEDLSIFGWLVVLYSYEEIFLVINGLKFNDSLTELIASFLMEKEIEHEIFSAKSKFARFVPYNDLYDYKNKRWKI